MIDRCQDFKALWDKEVQNVIDKRYTKLQQNQEQQAQKQRDYRMKLQLWAHRIDKHSKLLKGWWNRLIGISRELWALFKLDRPIAAPLPEDIITEFNILMHLVDCKRAGYQVPADHCENECPHRWEVPANQKHEPYFFKSRNPANYTQVQEKMDELFEEISMLELALKPSAPNAMGSSSPEDCEKIDKRAFNVSVVITERVHGNKLVFKDTKTAHAYITRVKDSMDNSMDIPSEEKDTLENRGALQYFVPEYLEHVTPGRWIHEGIGNITTPMMIEPFMTKDLHPGEVAFVKTKIALHVRKLIWMDCIRRVKDNTDLTSKDKDILETKDAFQYFLPEYLEHIAPVHKNIHGEPIGKIMTPLMVKLATELHAELMRFELERDSVRQSLKQVHAFPRHHRSCSLACIRQTCEKLLISQFNSFSHAD